MLKVQLLLAQKKSIITVVTFYPALFEKNVIE